MYICEHSNDFPGRPRMLSLLNISNIALIDELRVEFGRGLNLLTGETGSGKSIIVDALGILIGGGSLLISSRRAQGAALSKACFL